MKKIYFLLFTFFSLTSIRAQISITSTGTAFTQNFDAMLGTSSTASLTANQWRAANNAGGTTWTGANLTATTQLGGTSAAVSAGGFYNYGDGVAASATDRALGFLSSGTAPWPGTTATPLSIYAHYQNNTGSLLSQLDGSFDIEKYRNGTNAQGFSINFYYSLDGSTWTAVAAGSQAFAANGNNAAVAPAATTSKTYSITGLSIASGTDFYLRWSYLVSSGTTATNAQGLAIDNVSITATGAPAATITVLPASLSNFSSLSGVPSAEQSYTVSGSSLTADISITPPAGFEISTGTGGSFVPTNPITLTQTGGVVGATTIYVRMNSAVLGTNTGNIANASTGATTQNVAVTGKVLDAEPTVQSAITSFANITNSSMDVNFSGGNGQKRILLIHKNAAVDSDPVDGTTYTASSTYGAGTQIGTGNYVVYAGTGTTVTVSGLNYGTSYSFAVYDYNDGYPASASGAENYLVPGGVGTQATISVPVPYVWIGGSSTWTTATNWLPTRLFPAANDILIFSDGTAETVTNVPNETIGQLNILNVTGGTNVTLQAASTATTLTIGGLAIGTDLTIDAGSSLNINTANTLTINLATGATGTVNGSMAFAAAAHRLTAVDSNAVTFNSGALFTAGAAFAGNSFGTTNLGSIVFAGGSEYDQFAGSNPFGASQPNSVLLFQTGSLYKVTGNSLGASFSGRKYSNVEFAGTGTASMTGGAAVVMDNLTITTGIVNIGMTGTPGHTIKGNISVAAGATLSFNPASAGTFNFAGTAPQAIGNLGTLGFNANQNVTINNTGGGITLNSPVTLLGAVNFTSGIVTTTAANLLTLGAAATVSGASNASYVSGPVTKIGDVDFTFPVGKTGTGYVPIGVSNYGGTLNAATDAFTAEYIRSSAAALGPVTDASTDHVSSCDYWTLDRTSGSQSASVTGYWTSDNSCGGPYVTDVPSVLLVHFNGTSWDLSSFGMGGPVGGSTTAAGSYTWSSVTNFSPFALGSISSGTNPLPISLNYLRGTKQGTANNLSWQVTCVSTPSVTLTLERSADGRSFTPIHTIKATAVQCEQPFDYADGAPLSGINYYRLKMTGVDGRYGYSNIITLINGSNGLMMVNIAPNPVVNGQFKLNISATKQTKMDVVITDIAGRIVSRKTVSLINGFNAVDMNVSNLAGGIYQLFGNTAEGKTTTLSFIKQ